MVGQAPRVGLVLGGGAVLGGAWEAGALQALQQETGWDPRQAEYLIGTSVGSLLAAVLAVGTLPGMDLIEAADHRAAAFPWPIPGSWDLCVNSRKERGLRRWIMTVAGMLPRGPLSTQPIQRSVRRRVPDGWPAGHRLWIVACDYRTGERVVFGRSGGPPADLAVAVAASCAIPGVYQPVRTGDRLYVDGGLYSPVNLDLLTHTDIDLAICLNPTSAPELRIRPKTIRDRLMGIAEHASHRFLVAEADALRASATPVLLVEPGPEDLAAIGLNLMNRTRIRTVFQTAVRTTTEQLRLPENRALIAPLVAAAVAGTARQAEKRPVDPSDPGRPALAGAREHA